MLTAWSTGFMNEKALNSGRMAAESHRQNAVLRPSSSMENKAKLTENRLSIFNQPIDN